MSSFRLVARRIAALSALVMALPAAGATDLRYARFEAMQIATAPRSEKLALGDHFSLEGWIFVERLTGFVTLFGKLSDPPAALPYHSANVQLDAGGSVRFFVATTAADSLRGVTSAPIPLRTWTHVVATLDGTAMRLYVDGRLSGSGTALGPPGGSTPITIGGGFLGSYALVGGFAGAIHDVRVWNRALSAEEVLAARNQTLQNTLGLLAWWPLTGSGADLTRDAGPNGLTLVMGLGNFNDRRAPRSIPASLLENPPFVLEPQAITPHTTGIAFPHLVDFDSDGFPDVIESPYDLDAGHYVARPIRAFHNDRTGRFSDTTATSLPEPRSQVYNNNPDFVCSADFNGDGRPDLFLGDSGPDESPYPGAQSRLLIQSAGGQLIDETAGRLPKVVAFTHGATCADIDGDGDIDIIDAKNNLTGPRIYVNDGRGFFTDGTEGRLPSYIVSLQRRFLCVVAIDVDGDGDRDLFWGEFDQNSASPGQQRGSRDVLLLNNGRGFFTDAPATALPLRTAYDAGTLSRTVADFDRDGWPDLLLAQTWAYRKNALQLFLNDRHGGFIDATGRIGGAPFPDVTSEPGAGGSIARVISTDLNRDGWPDFLICTHDEYPLRMYINTGDANFIDASEALPNVGYGWVEPGDLDRDGDVDLFIAVGQAHSDLYVARNAWAYKAKADRKRAVRR